MRLMPVVYIVSYLLITSIAANAGQEVIVLHTPPDRTVIEYDILNLSLEVTKGAVDLIKVTVDGKDRKEIVPDLGFECFSVILNKLGTSTVEVSAFKGETLVATFVRNVFRRSDLVGEYRKPPLSFKISGFHMEAHPECRKCHVLEVSGYDKKPISPSTFASEKFSSEQIFAATSTCYSCHKSITKKPYVHGPASVWSCLSCHDNNAAIRYSVRKPVKDVCYGCHVEQKKEWNSKKYIHGPVNVGKCTICHSPHSSNYAFNLFKSTWDLCVNCHAEKATGQHVLGDTMFKKGHPTKGRKDPVRIGKELTCASCHNPHASNYPHLWAFEVNDVFELCKKCHFDK
ncbi:doubled CXXCH motif [bacterium BMS3Abin09]|nr:doubled CXXCH motif [bacterium BMS3Abin09]GBE41600.1 doubled CXXCH motif [bacterium BMS3Bbin09]